ncbi:MAG: hypothetical protein J6S49_07310 [Erysipelotrichaceae bacterium]|nr:hypothetical protein [Erysipelotrichaceae bacterium]
MHEVLIRFRFIDCGKTVECALDERLSFRDNLILLEQILELNIREFAIYDPQKKIFLKEDVAIKEFNISSFILLYIFNQSQDNL